MRHEPSEPRIPTASAVGVCQLSKDLLKSKGFSLCDCLDKYKQSAEDLETAKKLVNEVKKERRCLIESLEAMETKIKETAKDLVTIKKTGIALL